MKPPARRIVLHCHRRVEHNLRLAGVRASVLLFEAASEGDTDKLRTLLDKDKYDVDWRGEAGMSPVHVAALHNHAECVKLLIKAGAKVNQCDNDGWTPLMAAAAFAEHKMVEMLLNEGANPTRRIQKGHHKGMNARDLVKNILESKGSMATKCLALLEGVPRRCRYSIQIRMCCALNGDTYQACLLLANPYDARGCAMQPSPALPRGFPNLVLVNGRWRDDMVGQEGGQGGGQEGGQGEAKARACC